MQRPISVQQVRLPKRARQSETDTFAAIRNWSGYDRTKRYLAFADWSDADNPLPNNKFVCGYREVFTAPVGLT